VCTETGSEACGVADAIKWPQPCRWQWHDTRSQRWSGRRRSVAWPTRKPSCASGTPHSLTWSDECLDNRSSQRPCRRRGQSCSNDVEEDRSLASPEDSAGCASWPSDGAPEGRACADRSAARCRRCRTV
jgi:hypothetical protein